MGGNIAVTATSVVQQGVSGPVRALEEGTCQGSQLSNHAFPPAVIRGWQGVQGGLARLARQGTVVLDETGDRIGAIEYRCIILKHINTVIEQYRVHVYQTQSRCHFSIIYN